MLSKKYSPIVLSKSVMSALYYVEEAIRFVLQDEMTRFLHMTINETRMEPSHHFGHFEISSSILCRNGKVIDTEAEINLAKGIGEWLNPHDLSLTFPYHKRLKPTVMSFHGVSRIKENPACTVDNFMGKAAHYCYSPEDEAIRELRKTLID